MKTLLTFCTVLSLLLSAPRLLADETNTRDAAALRATMAGILKGFAEDDVDAVMQYHHPDVMKALSYTKVLTGREAVRADLAGTLGSFHLEFIEHNLESLLIQDDHAIEQTTFAIRGTPKNGGASWIFRGRAMVLYVRYAESPSGWASLRELVQPAGQ